MRRRRGWRATARTIAIILALIIFVILSPAIIFLVLPWTLRSYHKRLEAAAGGFACLSCSRILGLESLQLADAAWRAYFNKLHEENPGCRIRVQRYVHAICPACGTRYTFLERERAFVKAPCRSPDGAQA
jgi:hypothetical protein